MKHLIFSLALLFPSFAQAEAIIGLAAVQEITSVDIPEPIRTLNNDERMCLATALYHEARGETIQGQIAVASVILTRRDADRWSDTICGNIKWSGAFSFVDPKTKRVPPAYEEDAWAQSWILAGLITEPVPYMEGADHYHTGNVNPSWNRSMVLIDTIDSHLFYRDPDTRHTSQDASS